MRKKVSKKSGTKSAINIPPLFDINGDTLKPVDAVNFEKEKELQALIENNLTQFSCRFIDSEFHTGMEHRGRIDTLALSANNHPVIIEYKKQKSSGLIPQIFSYIAWLRYHKGDFEIAARKRLGYNIEVDWRVIHGICFAPSYGERDLQAVKIVNSDIEIELLQYRLGKNNSLGLEKIN